MTEKVEVIRAHYDSKTEWKLDPLGFFTIKPFPDEGLIRVRYYKIEKTGHKLICLFEGTNAEELYNTIVRKNIISLMEHAAYLGTELQKAEIAMRKRIDYVQDDPLQI